MNTQNKQNYDTLRGNIESELSFAIGMLTALEKEVVRANKSTNQYGRKIDLSYYEEKHNKAIGALNAAFSFAFKSNLLLEEVDYDSERGFRQWKCISCGWTDTTNRTRTSDEVGFCRNCGGILRGEQ